MGLKNLFNCAALLLSLMSPAAFAVPTPAPKLPPLPTKVEFMRTVRERWGVLSSSYKPTSDKLVVGQTAYLKIPALIRGQEEISIDNIFAKLSEKIANGDVSWNEKRERWELAHDSGKSAVSLKDPIVVVKGKQGYVIADGHHDLFLSLYLGAESIAVQLKDDLSEMKKVEFWETLKSRELVYLSESSEELAKDLPLMTDVKDNPNRYLATLIALKIKAKLENGVVSIKKIKGTSSAGVWVKVNDGVPFIEFYVAQVLTQAGISYDSSWGRQVPRATVAKCRRALVTAAKSDPRIKSIPLVASLNVAAKILSDHAIAQKIVAPVLVKGLLSSRCRAVFE